MTTNLAIAGVLLAAFAAGPALAFDPIVSLNGAHLTVRPYDMTDEILATTEQTDGQIGVVTLASPGPGFVSPSPAHANEASFWYVLEGTYEFRVGAKVLEGGPGTFIAVDKGQPLGIMNETKGKLLAIFTPGGYEHFFMDSVAWAAVPGLDIRGLERRYGVTRAAP